MTNVTNMMKTYSGLRNWVLGGVATAWYAGARLFRRPAGAGWGGTVAGVRRALDLWIAGRAAG